MACSAFGWLGAASCASIYQALSKSIDSAQTTATAYPSDTTRATSGKPAKPRTSSRAQGVKIAMSSPA